MKCHFKPSPKKRHVDTLSLFARAPSPFPESLLPSNPLPLSSLLPFLISSAFSSSSYLFSFSSLFHLLFLPFSLWMRFHIRWELRKERTWRLWNTYYVPGTGWEHRHVLFHWTFRASHRAVILSTTYSEWDSAINLSEITQLIDPINLSDFTSHTTYYFEFHSNCFHSSIFLQMYMFCSFTH